MPLKKLNNLKSQIRTRLQDLRIVLNQSYALLERARIQSHRRINELETQKKSLLEKTESYYRGKKATIGLTINQLDPYFINTGIEWRKNREKDPLIETISSASQEQFNDIRDRLPAHIRTLLCTYFDKIHASQQEIFLNEDAYKDQTQNLKRSFDIRKAEIEKSHDSRITAIETDFKDQKNKIKKSHDSRIDAIRTEFEDKKEEINEKCVSRIKAIETEFDNNKNELEQERTVLLAQLESSYTKEREVIEQRYEEKKKALNQKRITDLAESDDLFIRKSKEAERRFSKNLDQLNGDELSELKRFGHEMNTKGQQIASKVQSLLKLLSQLRSNQPTLPLYQRDWIDADWQPFSPPLIPPQEGYLRVGRRFLNTPIGKMQLPVLIPFYGESHLWIKFHERNRPQALAYSISLLLRLFAATVPGQLSLVLYDPKELGTHFRLFNNLRTFGLFRIAHKPSEIEDIVEDLIDKAVEAQQHIDQQYTSAFEMNADLEKAIHKHTVIVLKDYPIGLDRRVLDKLDIIGRSGHLTGLHILGLIGGLKNDEEERIRTDPTVHGTYLQFEQDRVLFSRKHHQVSDNRSHSSQKREGREYFFFDTKYSEDFPRLFLDQLRKQLESPTHISRRLIDHLPKLPEIGSHLSTYGLRTPIGYDENNNLVHIQFNDELVHALVRGATGSGKSTFLYELILGLAARYSPDELQLVLLDDKEGVEFSWFGDLLPHVTLLELNKDAHFAFAILEHLVRTMNKRNVMFREEAKVNDIIMFRNKMPDKALPRILLVWDDTYKIFKDDTDLSDKVRDLLEQIAKSGRSAGIHMVLATQDLSGIEYRLKGVVGQFAIRLNLFSTDLDDFETSYKQSRDTIPTRAGEAQCVGLYPGDNRRYQKVRFLEFEKKDDLQLQEVETLIRGGMQKYPIPNPKILKLGAPVDARRHARFIKRRLEDVKVSAPVLFLGDPITIRDPSSLVLKKDFACNLLLVGKEELLSPLLALQFELLFNQRTKVPLRFYLFTGNRLHRDTSDILDRCLSRGIDLQMERYQFDRFIEVYQECIRERDELHRHAFFVWNAETLWDIRRLESDYEKSELWDGLSNNLQSGPQRGIHLLAWSPVVAGIESLISPLDIYTAFQYRVASDIDRDSIRKVTNDNWNQTLGENRAILFERDKEPLVFAPYSFEEPIMNLDSDTSQVLRG